MNDIYAVFLSHQQYYGQSKYNMREVAAVEMGVHTRCGILIAQKFYIVLRGATLSVCSSVFSGC